MKIQPIDSSTLGESAPHEPTKPPAAKGRFRRLFERQFPGVLKTVKVEQHFSRDGCNEFDPSSACLAKMVQNFIEYSSGEKAPAVRCGRHRCNCFNGKSNDDSEDEADGLRFIDSNLFSSSDACENLKSLVSCASVAERNLLADAEKIVDQNKLCKRKDGVCRTVVAGGLVALGYDASICKSRWDKSPSHPPGEYEYVDAIVGKERFLIDIDFRSEFEIARSTKRYRGVLQALPHIFVGKPDRLQNIVLVVTDAGKQSLKKMGMHFPPWRKADYVQAKWLSPYTRTPPSLFPVADRPLPTETKSDMQGPMALSGSGQRPPPKGSSSAGAVDPGEDGAASATKVWMLPAVKPEGSPAGARTVTGLASVIGDRP